MDETSKNHVGKTFVDDFDKDHDCGEGVSDGAQNDENLVRRSQLPSNTRIIGPDDMVTMDYNKDRLNITIDDDCKIIDEKLG